MLNEALMKIIENSNKYIDHLPDFNPKDSNDKIAIYKYNVKILSVNSLIYKILKK